MPAFQFKHVRIESFAYCTPPHKVASIDLEKQMQDLYNRLEIPLGTLEKLTGIENRYFFDRETKPSQAATQAGLLALDKMRFDREKIGALFNCSVTRDNFEPATACNVHANLGLSQNAMAMDISNACLGFSNAIVLLANMIENGMVEAGLIVSGESLRFMIEDTLELLNSNTSITRSQLLNFLPVFTLGSASTAMVLCHENIASTSHALLGSIAKTASEHNNLCVGFGEWFYSSRSLDIMGMETQSNKLITAASHLGAKCWQELSAKLGWQASDVDLVIAHQVGKMANGNKQFFNKYGLDEKKEFSVYKEFGNTSTCGLPKALMIAAEGNKIKEKDKIILGGYGSGLGTTLSGVIW